MRPSRGLQPEVPPLAPLLPRPEPIPTLWRWVAVLVLAAYIGLSAGHIYATPVLPPNAGSFINAPDEPAHWGYVQILAREGRLPRQGDPTYEWHQPPLYYAATAGFFGLGPYAGRWLSVSFGLVSVCLILLSVRRLFPADPILAVTAMSFAALLPMRQAVYAAVGNDALLEMLCSALFFALIPAFTHGFTARRAAFIGLILGAALLTKANAILLIPVLLFALVLLRRLAGETPQNVLLGSLVLFALAFVTSAPMAIRNVQLYGQLTPIRAFQQEFAGTSKATDWIGRKAAVDLWSGNLAPGEEMTRGGYLQLVAAWTLRTAIAGYTPLQLARIGQPLFAPPWFYAPYGLLSLCALAGLVRLHFRAKEELTVIQTAFVRLMLTFTGLVVISFAGFVWTYFQAQGRYLYPAMLPLSVLGSLGVNELVPGKKREMAALGIIVLMAVLAFLFLYLFVQPTYEGGLSPGAP